KVGRVSAKTRRPDSIAYTATKFAVQGMTHQLTMDGRKYGVVSSVIHPGATLSAFSQRRGRTKAGWGPKPDDDTVNLGDRLAPATPGPTRGAASGPMCPSPRR